MLLSLPPSLYRAAGCAGEDSSESGSSKVLTRLLNFVMGVKVIKCQHLKLVVSVGDLGRFSIQWLYLIPIFAQIWNPGLVERALVPKLNFDDFFRKYQLHVQASYFKHLLYDSLSQQVGKTEFLAIGGPWSASQDGANPQSDPQVLINTATRNCKALIGIDLSNCKKW